MALSEICTAEMCRELVGDLLKIMKNGTSFVKKKAALAATKIIKKLPETCADFSEKVEVLMEDRHHGVLLSTLGLVEEILK
jgi:AP-1 complex subunit gamma-1